MLLQSDEISGKSCHKWSNCWWLPLFAFRVLKLCWEIFRNAKYSFKCDRFWKTTQRKLISVHYPLMVSFVSQISFTKESTRMKFFKFVHIIGYWSRSWRLPPNRKRLYLWRIPWRWSNYWRWSDKTRRVTISCCYWL